MEEIQIIEPNSLLIVTIHGELKRIFTPFSVECLIPIEPFSEKDRLEVQKIFTSQERTFIYLIEGNYYAYFYFVIL